MAAQNLFSLAKPNGLMGNRGIAGPSVDPSEFGYGTAPSGGGLFDLPSPFPKDSWPPKKGGWAIGDVVNTGGNIANWMFQQFSGLTPEVAQLYQQVLSGNMPEVTRQLLAPVAGQLNAQVPTAIRQAEDTLQGGALAQAKAAAIQAPIQGMAQAMTSLYNPLISGAIEAGQNAPMRAWQILRDGGLLRVQDKQAKNSGGGK